MKFSGTDKVVTEVKNLKIVLKSDTGVNVLICFCFFIVLVFLVRTAPFKQVMLIHY